MYPIQQQAEDAAEIGNASELRDCLARGATLEVGIYLLVLGNGDVATFQTILDFGGDANWDMHYSGTPLILALKHNHQALFCYLLSINVDPNKGSLGHWLPPLSVAVRLTKDIQWIQHLLEIGARIEGTGALHIAAFQYTVRYHSIVSILKTILSILASIIVQSSWQSVSYLLQYLIFIFWIIQVLGYSTNPSLHSQSIEKRVKVPLVPSVGDALNHLKTPVQGQAFVLSTGSSDCSKQVHPSQPSAAPGRRR
ncbi:hypothetical protein BBP40_011328 [Aspergillus hancockii]|nr:hypothetical protein BBP40_011328 [Aspergillus hancockii]